jgi:hypothetical protein
MDRAQSKNMINEISTSPAMKRMTIGELGELSKRIQTFLASQGVGKIKTSAIGNVSIKLQDILNASDVEEITINELGHLKTKVQEILISHDRKFIKNNGTGDASINYRGILNSPGLKKLSDKGVTNSRSDVKEVMLKYCSVSKLNLPGYIGGLSEEIIIE